MKKRIAINEKIKLRAVSPDWYQDKYNAVVRSRDHLLPWLPWVYYYDTHGAEGMKEYEEGKAKEFDDGVNYTFDIFYEGEFAGCVEIMHISEQNHNCELGYWLDVKQAGHGIMTQAVQIATELAYKELGMHLVVILASSRNHRSCAVAQRCGYRLDGTLPERLLLEGEWHDVNVYSKIRKD